MMSPVRGNPDRRQIVTACREANGSLNQTVSSFAVPSTTVQCRTTRSAARSNSVHSPEYACRRIAEGSAHLFVSSTPQAKSGGASSNASFDEHFPRSALPMASWVQKLKTLHFVWSPAAHNPALSRVLGLVCPEFPEDMRPRRFEARPTRRSCRRRCHRPTP